MEYKDLIKRYPVFYYHDYMITETAEELCVRFDFEIEGLSHFNPEFWLLKPKGTENLGLLKDIRIAAFSLGMIELISYWKMTCAPTVVVRCGSLDEEQISWWKHLYFHGLGEFFYNNKIDADPETFMTLKTIGEEPDGLAESRSFSGNLIPVGGGKDSFVTLELLADLKSENTAFVINRVRSAIHSAEAAGYTEGKDLVVVSRTLDPRMLEFNKQGYLNGHTPFSALAAFASNLTALVYGRKYVCLSNEASANESTIANSTVNHQYSKTFEFEKNFLAYQHKYLTPEVSYFSMLRPLSELQIAGLFSACTEYLPVFRSCNVGSKQEKWCGHCAKCLFVCIMLSAFLKDEDLVSIFGADMLNDATMRTLFHQLSGQLEDKPFECVGTREEVNVAIAMSIRAHESANSPLPLLYQEYKKSSFYDFYKDRSIDWMAWNEENQVPEDYQARIHAALLRRQGA